MSTSQYNELRDAYWNAQRAFREVAIAEIQRRMPEGVETVVLDFNDTPRLTVVALIDAEGNDVLMEHDCSPEYEDMDGAAADMEFADWDEARSYLMRHGDGIRFAIQRETAS